MSAPIDLDGLLRRLHLPTVRRLYGELATRAEAESLSYRDYLATLIAEEVAHRAQTRIERSVRRARFPFLATIEDFNFTFQTSIRQALLGSYLGPELITEGRSVVFLGPTGTGKTHLGIAIGYRAIQNGGEALFVDANTLLERLARASEEGRLRDIFEEYLHPHVLVVDEVGYLTHRPDAANVLFHVVNERYLRRKSMVFTTNKPPAAWGRVLHDADLAEAILDRVLERGRLIELRGPSYRTRHVSTPLKSEPGEPQAPTPSLHDTPVGGAAAPLSSWAKEERIEGCGGAGGRGKKGVFPLPPPPHLEPARISGKLRPEYLEPTILNAAPEVREQLAAHPPLHGEADRDGEIICALLATMQQDLDSRVHIAALHGLPTDTGPEGPMRLAAALDRERDPQVRSAGALLLPRLHSREPQFAALLWRLGTAPEEELGTRLHALRGLRLRERQNPGMLTPEVLQQVHVAMQELEK